MAAEAECLQLVGESASGPLARWSVSDERADAALDDFGMSGHVHLIGHTGFLNVILQDVPPHHRRAVLKFLEIASSKGVALSNKQLSELAKQPGAGRKTLDVVHALNQICESLTMTNTGTERS